jgi:hypothetical protein
MGCVGGERRSAASIRDPHRALIRTLATRQFPQAVPMLLAAQIARAERPGDSAADQRPGQPACQQQARPAAAGDGETAPPISSQNAARH